MTDETIAKLEAGFLMGFSDREACLYADINPATLYRFCDDNPDFSERKELLKEQIKMRAKQNISEAINAKDKQLSQWLLERRDPDFRAKQETELKGGITVNVIRFDDNPPSSISAETLSTALPKDQSAVQDSGMAPAER